MAAAVVLYQPTKTRSPENAKLEIKVPVDRGKTIILTEPMWRRLIGFLRYHLDLAGIKSIEKPSFWTGIPLRDPHKFGSVEKMIHGILATEPKRTMRLSELRTNLKKLGSGKRLGAARHDNLVQILERLHGLGDVDLIRRDGRIRSVRLVDYSAIAS